MSRACHRTVVGISGAAPLGHLDRRKSDALTDTSSGCRPRKSPLASKGAFALLCDERKRKGLPTKLDGRDRMPLLEQPGEEALHDEGPAQARGQSGQTGWHRQARLATLAPALVRHPRGGWRCATVSTAGRPGARPAGDQPAVHSLGQGASGERGRPAPHQAPYVGEGRLQMSVASTRSPADRAPAFQAGHAGSIPVSRPSAH